MAVIGRSLDKEVAFDTLEQINKQQMILIFRMDNCLQEDPARGTGRSAMRADTAPRYEGLSADSIL